MALLTPGMPEALISPWNSSCCGSRGEMGSKSSTEKLEGSEFPGRAGSDHSTPRTRSVPLYPGDRSIPGPGMLLGWGLRLLLPFPRPVMFSMCLPAFVWSRFHPNFSWLGLLPLPARFHLGSPSPGGVSILLDFFLVLCHPRVPTAPGTRLVPRGSSTEPFPA